MFQIGSNDSVNNLFFDPRIWQFIGALVALYIAYWFSLRAYFRQKEHESTKTRYLDNGLDLYTSSLEYALSVYRHNWALLLRTAKQFREMEDQLDINDFYARFMELDHSALNLTFNIRVKYLVGDSIFWTAFQGAMSFVGTRNDQVKADFGDVLKKLLVTPDSDKKSEFLKKTVEWAEESADESKKYDTLVNRAENLAEFFAGKHYRYSQLKNFQNDKRVKTVLKEIKKIFPDEPE